jgi:hypothetical protein
MYFYLVQQIAYIQAFTSYQQQMYILYIIYRNLGRNGILGIILNSQAINLLYITSQQKLLIYQQINHLEIILLMDRHIHFIVRHIMHWHHCQQIFQMLY